MKRIELKLIGMFLSAAFCGLLLGLNVSHSDTMYLRTRRGRRRRDENEMVVDYRPEIDFNRELPIDSLFAIHRN